MRKIGVLMLIAATAGLTHPAGAVAAAPWGSAPVLDITYRPQRVLYDVTSGDPKALANILDRVSYLSSLYQADPFDSSIVVVIHGDSIGMFAQRNYETNRELMTRAQSLSSGGIIQFRMCRAAAKLQGFEPKDVHGFVSMVPMADAEIVRLQKEDGYAYMH
jgi:uncharacterized protein